MISNNNKSTPYTTLFNSFKRHIRTLTAALNEKDFSSFKSLDAFKSHRAENRKLNQHQVGSYLNFVNDINTWLNNDYALSTLIAKSRDEGKSESYVSEAYAILA